VEASLGFGETSADERFSGRMNGHSLTGRRLVKVEWVAYVEMMLAGRGPTRNAALQRSE